MTGILGAGAFAVEGPGVAMHLAAEPAVRQRLATRLCDTPAILVP